MATQMKTLTFTISSALTATTTVDCTGFGFQPVAFIAYTNGRSDTTDAVGLADSRVSIGGGVSTSARGAAYAFYDQGTTNAIGGGRQTALGCVGTCTATGTEDGRLDFDSFLSDGIRLIVDDQLPATIRVQITAFGGSDITNVFYGHFLVSNSTGNQDFTTDLNGTSIGFDPGSDSLFIFLGNGELYYSSSAEQVDEDIIQMFMGAATSNADQWCFCINSDDDSATMDTDSYGLSGDCMASIAQGGAASCSFRGAFVQSITGGFRINRIKVPAYLTGFQCLIVKGGDWKVGTITTQTDTTTDITVSGLSFQPTGALFVSHCLAASTADTTQAGARFSIGGCSSTSDEICQGFQDEDATGNMETEAGIEHDEVYQRISSSATNDGLMRAQSFPNSDGFTMRMDDADPTAAIVGYITGGDAAAAGGQPMMKRWEGMPGVRQGGPTFGRGW